MSNAERIITQKMAGHEKGLLAVCEASKEVPDQKSATAPRGKADRARIKVAAANQSAADLEKMDVTLDRGIKALGPEKAAVAMRLKQALKEKADAIIEQNLAVGLRVVKDYERTDRAIDRSGKPTEAKPASEPTRELAAGASEYDRLSRRNEEILIENGGTFPATGPLAQEFETNDKAMATILQKPLGKSDEDAKTARALQATPGVPAMIASKLGVGSPVENYRKALEVNRARITNAAAEAARLEGKAGPAAAAPAAKPVPAEELTAKDLADAPAAILEKVAANPKSTPREKQLASEILAKKFPKESGAGRKNGPL